MTSASSDEEKAKEKQDAGARAGRGGLAIAVAKVSFILVGFIQQLVFPRVLDEAGYGAVARMLAVVSIVNNVVVAMSIQGVSRFVAGAPPGEELIALRKTLHVHAVLALLISTIFGASAGLIANYVEAPYAATPLRVGALVVLCYGVYAPLVGGLNGRHRFLDQAGLDIFYGVSRTIAMSVGAFVFARVLGGDGSLGAAIGFVAAATLIVPIAITRSGLGKAGAGRPEPGEYLRFLLPLIISQVGLNLLLWTDFLLLSKAAGEAARELGLDPKEADKLLAPYRANQLFGFLPYQMLMSVQFVLFPMLAKASSEDDDEGVKRLVRQGMRLAFVLAGLIGGVVASVAHHLTYFAFPENIAAGGQTFVRVYVLGLSSLAILGVATSALASLRREVLSMILTWLGAGLIALAITLARPEGTFGVPLMQATAFATAGGMVAAAAIAAITLRVASGALVSPLTLVRVGAATAVVFALGGLFPRMHKLVAPLEAAILALVYLGVLIATRELGKDDLAIVQRVLGRKKQA